MKIDEYPNCWSKGHNDRISISNAIMKECVCNTGEQRIRYKIKPWEKQGSFDILHGVSKNITLVQFMDTFRGVNHAVSIVVYLKFDSKYKNALPLTLYSFNLMGSPLVVEGIIVRFEIFFYAFRYVNNTGKLKIDDQCIII